MGIRLQPLAPLSGGPTTIGIVVPVHNALGYLRRCVSTLQATMPPSGLEVVFVDDASDAATQEFLDSQAGWAKVIRFSHNRGFSAACNEGARNTSAPWVFFANSDLEFRPKWFADTQRLLSEKPDFGAFGFKLAYPDGTLQHAGLITTEDPQNLIPFGMMGLHVGAPSDLVAANQFLELDAVTAAALLVRGQDFDGVGGFDEGFFNGGEDIDLCLKLRARRVRIGYSPSPSFIHHESKSGPERWLKTLANQRIVAQKWHGRARPNAVINESFALEATGDSYSPSTTVEPEFLIVVVAENHLSTLNDSLESVRSNAGLFNRIAVLDVDSHDGTPEFLKLLDGADSRVDIHCTSRRASCQEIIRVANESNAPFVAVVDAASFVSPSWLVRLRRAIEQSGADFAVPLTNGGEPDQCLAIYGGDFGGASLDAQDIAVQLALSNNRQCRDVMKSAQPPFLTSCEKLENVLLGQSERGVVAHDVYVHRIEHDCWTDWPRFAPISTRDRAAA